MEGAGRVLEGTWVGRDMRVDLYSNNVNININVKPEYGGMGRYKNKVRIMNVGEANYCTVS